jgi:pimeloyl-ACP methyl ester carboxylesterase
MTSVRGADGLILAADSFNDTSESIVVLLHGGGQTRHSWARTAAGLAALGYRVLTVDQRGHGDSQWARDGRYTAAHFASDLVHLAGDLPSRPVVVGASLGGQAALLAAGRSDTLRGVVLADIGPRIRDIGADRIKAFMGSCPDGFDSLDDAADHISRFTGRARPADLSGLAKVLRPRAGGGLRWHWDLRFLDGAPWARSAEGAVALVEATRRLRVPVLLIRGEHSEIVTVEDAAEFLELAPTAQVVTIPGARHMLAGEDNAVFSGELERFLSGIDWSGDT